MPDIRALENRTIKALAARENRYARQGALAWKDALDTMRVDMSKIYEKYAVDGVLSRADMAKYNRYATMEKQMIEITQEAVVKTRGMLDRMRPDMYNESFYRYAWTIDNSENIRVAWGVLNKDAVIENLANNFYFISKKTYGQNAVVGIRRALNDGLITGKSYTAMIKDLKQSINTSNSNMMRILRTEGQDAVNSGQDNTYLRAEEKGVDGVRKWDATIDGKTRPAHQALDNQPRQPDGLYDGPAAQRAPYPVWAGLIAKQRIHCRCSERFEVTDFPPQLRRSRDGGVIEFQSYDEWSKSI